MSSSQVNQLSPKQTTHQQQLSDSEDYDDQFDFEDDGDETKNSLLKQVNTNCLELAVRNFVPIDIMAIFEMKSAEETIDRSAELRREVLSFIEIVFDTKRCQKMFINFPKHMLPSLGCLQDKTCDKMDVE